MSTQFKNAVSFRFPDELTAEIEQAAKEDRSRPSEVVRRALTEHFERRRKAAGKKPAATKARKTAK